MLNRKEFLRLAALAVVLTAVLVLTSVLLTPPAAPTVLPTGMLLPSETDPMGTAVAALPSESVETLALSDAAADSVAVEAAVVERPIVQVRDTSAPTTDSEPTTEALLPTAFPFPTLDLPGGSTARDRQPQSLVPNQLVIAFQVGTSQQNQDAYLAALGGEVQARIAALNVAVVTLSTLAMGSSLPESALVLSTEPDYYVRAQVDLPPDDPYFAQQWALPVIAASVGWQALPNGVPTITIAVIDSGICADHPDLAGQVLPGWDYVEGDALPQDAMGHGCGVAGILAARVDNGIGLSGIAPHARILPLRVLDAEGLGTYSDVAAAIVYAADHGAQIINLSLGGSAPSSVLQQAVDYAVGKGVTLVASAGNTGTEQVLYPAAYDSVIAVGSVDQTLHLSSFSSRGAGVDLLAPGRDILTTSTDGSIQAMSGTSFAAPQVAGIAALELAVGRTLTLSGGIVQFGGAAPLPTPAPDGTRETMSAELNASDSPSRGVKAETHLSSNLAAVASAWNQNEAQALQLGETFGLEIAGEQIAVTVTMIDAQAANAAKAQVPGLGGEVTAEYDRWFDALVPISVLTPLAALPGVALVEPIVRVFPAEEVTPEAPNRDVSALAGSIQTAGVTASNAMNWHAAGIVGSGITVAVLDSGFSNYSLLQSLGELPPAARLEVQGPLFSDRHGSAVAEIVYDMAPGINMVLASPTSATQMAQTIANLATHPAWDPEEWRVKIITSSIGYYNLESGDGTGPVSDAIAYALSQGVLYTQAAGNQAQYNWQNPFSDADADGWLDFAAGGVEINQLGTLPAGFPLQLYLRWNGWPTTNQDYDFYIFRYNPTTAAWETVAGSENVQTGTQPPTEALYYVTPQAGAYGIGVFKYAATGGQVIDLMGHNAPAFQFAMPERSLIDPASSTSTFAVAALNRVAPFTLESYSSRGPAFGAGGALGSGNSQPRLAGFSNVDTFSYGVGIFNGTSAATPHIAGAAALVWQANPGFTVAQVRAFLESRAVDMGTAGYDLTYGMGRLHLGTPPTVPVSIVTQPQSQNVPSGQTRILTVVATGTAPLTYQWYRGIAPDTSNPVGTNAASFTTPPVSANTAYWVRVSNAVGQVNSTTAAINVQIVCPTFPYTVPAGNAAALINAIHCANLNGAGTNDVIHLTASTYALSAVNSYNLYGNNGLPIIVDAAVRGSLTINGNGAIIERVAGSPSFRFFYVEPNGHLILDRVTLRGGASALFGQSNYGGGLYNAGALDLTNSVITQNTSTSDYFETLGGGIYSSGSLTLVSTTIADNHTTGLNNGMSVGGGIYSSAAGTVTMVNSRFEGNSANWYGGGIASYGPLSVETSTFAQNTASAGGGIFVTSALLVRNSAFLNNSATSGGAIDANNIDATIEYSLFEGNTATTGNGGAIDGAGNESKLTVFASTFINNRAEGQNSFGGAVYSDGYAPELRIAQSLFSYNYAGWSGGAIAARGKLHLSNSTIFANSADYGVGGLGATSDATIISNTIMQNTSNRSIGGGMSAGANATVHNNLLVNNTGAGGQPGNCSPSVVILNARDNVTTPSEGTCYAFREVHFEEMLLDPAGVRDNGGLTHTIALMIGSQLIDSGFNDFAVGENGLPLTTDQRGDGFPRINNRQIDVGAFEANVPGSPARERNLVRNGDFRAMEAEWNFAGDIVHDIAEESLIFRRLQGGGDALVYQDWNYEIAPGTPLQVEVDLANSIGISRRVDVVLRSLDGAQSMVCSYTVLPNTPLQTFTLQGKPTVPWHGLRLEIHPFAEHPSAMVQLDNVVVQRLYELLTSETSCTSPTILTATPTPTATNTPSAATVTSTPTITPTITSTPTSGAGIGFYRAVDLGSTSGSTIDGNAWQGDTSANFSTNGYAACMSGLTLTPATDATHTAMLRCVRWNQGLTLNLSAVPNGSYDVYLYTVEDDWAQTFGVTLEGITVASNLITGSGAGQWNKYGPWRVVISDGAINLAITGTGWVTAAGVEVWSAGSSATPTQTPTRTHTPLAASATPTVTNTALPGTPTLTRTNTPVSPTATPTLTRTNTPVAATMTHTSTATSTPTVTSTNPVGSSGAFYRAINLGGSAASIDGNAWEGNSAPNFSSNGYAACFPSLTLVPPTDATRAAMLRCVRWNQNLTLNLSAVPNGSYDVYLYTIEDDWQQTFGVMLEGITVASNLITGSGAGQWNKYGPWRVNLTDGTINLGITGSDWVTVAGTEIWSAGSSATSTPTPTPTNTPGVPTATPTVTPTLVPGTATATATRTNTPLSPTATPTFTLTSPVTPTPTTGASGFYRAVNLGSTTGSTIDGNAWSADPAANFSTNGYSACFPSLTLVPPTDATRAAMLRCVRWNQNLTLNLSAVPNGSYDVYLYTIEDNWQQTFGVMLEGITVASNLITGSGAGQWNKYGPWRVNLTDGTINLGITGSDWVTVAGVEVWGVGGGALTALSLTDDPGVPATFTPVPAAMLLPTQTAVVASSLLPTRIESEGVPHSAGWVAMTQPEGASGGTYLMNQSAGASFSLDFTGTQVGIHYVQGISFGSFQVELDGVIVQTVTTEAPVYEFGAQLILQGLNEGWHTLRLLTNTGVVGIDAFSVYGAQGSTPVDLLPTLATPFSATPTVTIVELQGTEVMSPPATPTPTPAPLTLPASASMDDGAPTWQASVGWSLMAEAAYGGAGLGWMLRAGHAAEVLRWSQVVDLRSVMVPQRASLSFLSQLETLSGSVWIEASIDGGGQWIPVSSIAPTRDWTLIEIDLTAFAGNLVQLQFVWQPDGSFAAISAPAAFWWLDSVLVQALLPMTATATPTSPVQLSTATHTAEPLTPTADLPTATATPTTGLSTVTPTASPIALPDPEVTLESGS